MIIIDRGFAIIEYGDYHKEVDIKEAEERYAKRCFQPTYDMTFKLMFVRSEVEGQ